MQRSVPRLLSGKVMRLLAFASALVFLCFSLPSVAFAAAARDDVDVDSVMQDVSVSLFQIDKFNAKLSVKGVAGAIEKLKAYGDPDESTFRYSIMLHGNIDIELLGSFYYKKTEKNPYVNMSSFLRWNHMKYDSRNFYIGADCVNWTVKLPNRVATFFDFSTVTSIDVSFRNAVRSKCSALKTIDAPLTDVILETPLKSGGMLKIVVPDGTTLRVYVDDPDLAAGYPISPNGKGTKTPVWYIKAVSNSYLWVEMQVDGQNASSFDDMEVTAGEFHLLKYDSNKYHPKTFSLDTGACRVEGDQLVLELAAPTQAFHYLKWIEVSMDNGANVSKYVVAH